MDWLLIAVGFTGALSLVYLVRLAQRTFRSPASVEVHVKPVGTCADVLAAHIRKARREVLVLAPELANHALAQTFIDTRLHNKVNVEIILDAASERNPASDIAFLIDQGVHPSIDPEHDPSPGVVIIIDRRTVITGSFRLDLNDGPAEESMVVLQNHPEAVAVFLQTYNSHKAHSRPAGARVEGHQATAPVNFIPPPPANEFASEQPLTPEAAAPPQPPVVPFPSPPTYSTPPEDAYDDPAEEPATGDEHFHEPLPKEDFVPLRTAELLAALRRDFGQESVPTAPPGDGV